MAIASDLIISSDSHVMEPVDLWKKGVPEKYREAAPLFPPHQVGEGFQQHAGGWDPSARMKEMEADGLSAEVLYPTLMLDLFALDDARLARSLLPRLQRLADRLLQCRHQSADRDSGDSCVQYR